MEKDFNMPLSYKTILTSGTGEIVEKKSRFIAHTAQVGTEEEAAAFIEGIRKEYWDARHNCHAFTIGLEPEITRCSDDGEPARTAGKPILDVLLGSGLKNSVIVVTRYFGGTLLGTGGLVRAYSAAARLGLENSVVIEKKLCEHVMIETDYSLIGKLRYMLDGSDIMVMGTEYSDKAVTELLIPVGSKGSFEKKLTDISGGKVVPLELGLCYGAVSGSEILLFEQ